MVLRRRWSTRTGSEDHVGTFKVFLHGKIKDQNKTQNPKSYKLTSDPTPGPHQGGLLDMSNWEETPGKTWDTLERPPISKPTRITELQ